MPNMVKTALLLGAMSALFLLIGDALGGAQGMFIGLVFAAGTNFASYWFSDKIVLRMYRAQEVGAGHRLHQVVSQLAARCWPANASRLHHSRAVSERLRNRTQPRPRRRCRHRGYPAHLERRGARRCPRSRTCAREASRHPDQLRGCDARCGDRDDLAVCDVLGCHRAERRPRRRREQPPRPARDDHPGSDCRHAHTNGHLPVSRVRCRCRWRGDLPAVRWAS